MSIIRDTNGNMEDSVKNMSERNQARANAMHVLHGLFVHLAHGV